MSEEAVLFVRSATDDESGAASRRAQEQAGREYAQKNGLRIAQVWEAKGKDHLESRRALRGFVEYVKANPGIQALLFQRPDRLSRRFRDWVELHDFCRKNGRELRFFGSNQSPQSDAMMLEMSAALYWSALESRREARRTKKPPTDSA
jgi:DNA invertase Pin-like site-specific DNA recombinase